MKDNYKLSNYSSIYNSIIFIITLFSLKNKWFSTIRWRK